jgi:hypothetical protein
MSSQHHNVDHEDPSVIFDDINMDEILLSMDVGGKHGVHTHSLQYSALYQLSPEDIPHRFDSPVVCHDETDSIQHMLSSAPNSPGDWRLSNAVHMELQENAKLPIFHWNVDRTGSSHNKLDLLRNRKARSDSIDDMSLQGSQGTAMDQLLLDVDNPHGYIAEAFLNVESSRHANFPTHSSAKYDSTHMSKGPNRQLQDFESSDFDPTPLSEIRHKHVKKPSLYEKMTSAVDSLQPQTSHGLPNEIHIPYWSRPDPLPIPSPPLASRTTVEPNEPLMAQSSGTDHDKTSEVTTDPMTEKAPVQPVVIEPAAVRQLSGSTKVDVVRPPVQHSAAHTVPRPALQQASLQQSQYGFGPKHVVPSVPANKNRSSSRNSGSIRGPLAAKVNVMSNKNGNSRGSQVSSNPRSLPSAQSSTVDDDDSGSGGCGLAGNEAYERKKQRAKTARVRLNESIDRLQIALNVAGTQSKQRLTMFDEQTVPYRIITDCIQCSDDAKKWDRPSFVGSAATMIQGLNAQCEALVRALHDERHARAQRTAASALSPERPRSSAVNDRSMESPTRVGGAKHGNTDGHVASTDASTDLNGSEKDSAVKRQRLNESVESTDHRTSSLQNGIRGDEALLDSPRTNLTLRESVVSLVFAEKSFKDRVASFLDPLSIVRCMRVSRIWKNWNVFSSDALWERLVLERFGPFNTRQWSAKLEDNDRNVASLILYKTMDAANVMPHFQKDGLLLLGEAKITGKVSAWTYLVERSNGETMRSVRRHSSMHGVGVYSSIPVVQLWFVIQNTGVHDDAVVIREQSLTVDTSTRRRGDEMLEIDWDDHLRKRILNLDGTVHVPHSSPDHSQSIYRELCRLRLFETIIIEANIHAKGCTTTSKFMQKSNFTKVLIQIRNQTTIPLVIPFPRDSLHLLP